MAGWLSPQVAFSREENSGRGSKQTSGEVWGVWTGRGRRFTQPGGRLRAEKHTRGGISPSPKLQQSSEVTLQEGPRTAIQAEATGSGRLPTGEEGGNPHSCGCRFLHRPGCPTRVLVLLLAGVTQQRSSWLIPVSGYLIPPEPPPRMAGGGGEGTPRRHSGGPTREEGSPVGRPGQTSTLPSGTVPDSRERWPPWASHAEVLWPWTLVHNVWTALTSERQPSLLLTGVKFSPSVASLFTSPSLRSQPPLLPDGMNAFPF